MRLTSGLCLQRIDNVPAQTYTGNTSAAQRHCLKTEVVCRRDQHSLQESGKQVLWKTWLLNQAQNEKASAVAMRKVNIVGRMEDIMRKTWKTSRLSC